MISFKGAQYSREVILFAVFFYVRYPVSYRDLEEIMAERATLAGIETAHMIRKGQTPNNGKLAFEQFADLTA